jgi:hypothetical protein
MRMNRRLAILVLSLWTFSQLLMLATHSGFGPDGTADGARAAISTSHQTGTTGLARTSNDGAAGHHAAEHGSTPADAPAHCDIGCLMIAADQGGVLVHPPLSSRHPSGVGSDPSEQPHFLTSPPPETFA